jgi:hypothetical protein
MKGIRCLSLFALVASAALVACGGGGSVGTFTADDVARNANSPAVAMSGTGRGQLAFQAEDGNNIGALPEIVAVPYTIASGLGDPGFVSGSNRFLRATSPRVAMDAAGCSLVMWHRQDMDQQTGSIITNIVVGGDVGEAVVLDSVAGEGIGFGSRHLVMDAAGNALAVWIRNGAVYAAQKPAIGNRWSRETLVGEAEAGQAVTYAQLAMNRAGQGLLAYNSVGGSNTGRVLARSIGFAFARPPNPPSTDADEAFFANSAFERGETLGTSQRLDDSDALLRSAEAPFAVARDGLGNGLAVWQERSGAVQARRYLADSGWTADRALLCAAGCGTIGPLVALDDRGNGFATYSFSTSDLSASNFAHCRSATASGCPITP